MDRFQEIIDIEEKRIKTFCEEIRQTLAAEQADRQEKDREMGELKQRKLDAVGWREKREIDEMIDRCRTRYTMRQYQDAGVLSQPYFGVLELDDLKLGRLTYCLGRRTFFDRSGRVLIVDWREAPISRLYYEYDAGEGYEEEIQGRERTGVVQTKRQVDTSGGRLQRVLEKGLILTRHTDGSWVQAQEEKGTLSAKEDKADHRLPEITALISRSQFLAITRPESGTVLLQGGAGSGKTTVGLHRIAYLAYQFPDRFPPHRILVVMFNRSLQHYISGVFSELGLRAGVQVETYHSWAAKRMRAAGMQISYGSVEAPGVVTRIKKHPIMLSVVELYLQGLLIKSRDWLVDQLHKGHDPQLHRVKAHLDGLKRIDDFRSALATHPHFAGSKLPEARKRLASRLLERLDQHTTDLHTILTHRKFMEAAVGPGLQLPPDHWEQIVQWQTSLRDQGRIDFADTGILLWIMQCKGIPLAQPGYAHILVDEAQDLGEVELATLLDAADEHQSITICGDMAQKIKGDVAFQSPEGFAGFIRSRQRKRGATTLSAETLEVGYRASRPIMDLAWHVLGTTPSMEVPRDGEPVAVIRTRGHQETLAEAQDVLDKYLDARPGALAAVVCRYKADADRVFSGLKARGIANLRRHERDDFSFEPGVIVTNAHQVKGLEFSAVLIVNPSAAQYKDEPESRMLLHVVITRASDRLWIVGHQPMAYGIDEWGREGAPAR